MRLRKLLAALVAVLSITGVLAGPAFAGKPFHDGDGSCADLFGGGGNIYSPDGTSYVASVNIDLATDPCRQGSYIATLYATKDNGSGEITSSTAFSAAPNDNNGITLNWQIPVATSSTVCVVVQSLDKKGNVLDTAPDGGTNYCDVGGDIAVGSPAGWWQ